MGGPKINTSYKKRQNRIGRRVSKCQGIGKRGRKRLHHEKKMRNLDKKMLRYYGELAKGKTDLKDPSTTQSRTRGRPTKMTGKKARKIRKVVQRTERDRSEMDVEIEVTKKTSAEEMPETSETQGKPDENDETMEDASRDNM